MKSTKNKLQLSKRKYVQPIAAAVIIAIITILGVHVLTTSHAQSPYAATAAASGTLSGSASIQSSSSGEYVRFGSLPSSGAGITGVPAGISPGATYESDFEAMTTSEQQAQISLMKSAGVKWLRLDMPSTFPYDTLVKDATSNGISVDAILQDWDTAATPAAMGSFATQAVNHLKPMGVETYEILNEPNGCNDVLSASAYTAILQSTYTAIKASDPSATVITGGLCPNSGSNEPTTYLTAMYAAGAKDYFDAFNMHPYSYPDTPDQTSDSWNPWSYLPELHSIMVSNGDGSKQIWLTEFGCPTGTDGGYPADCTDATLATQIADAFTSARGLSYVGPLFVYDWQDYTTGGGGDFGLYTASGAPKPQSLAAYEAAASSN